MSSMRTLVFSDIHNNIGNIRRLREQEDNVYDSIIVAGDIGSDIESEFYAILDSFKCHAFVVFGNWDSRLEYRNPLSKRCALVHQSIETTSGFYITGFSGCPTSWGSNPIYLELESEHNKKHEQMRSRMEDERQESAKQRRENEIKYCEELEELNTKTPDRRLTSYRSRVKRLEKRLARRNANADMMFNKSYRSREYRQYQDESEMLSKHALTLNRRMLFDIIRCSDVPCDKLIIVTHERMFRIAEERVTPLAHISGHVHEFKVTEYKGTCYLNAAAIDNGYSEMFGRAELLPIGYCSVVFSEGNVSVERKLLS